MTIDIVFSNMVFQPVLFSAARISGSAELCSGIVVMSNADD